MNFKEYLSESKNKEVNIKSIINKMKKSNSFIDFYDDLEDANQSETVKKELIKIVYFFFTGGLSNKKTVSAGGKQLSDGIKVEYEHYNKNNKYSELVAEKIAKDHLAESKVYYTKLKEAGL